MMPRFGTFTGGIDLADDKEATINSDITPLAGLKRLLVPLATVAAPAAAAVVAVGQAVARGALLAKGGAGQVDVYAPRAGRVAGFGYAVVPDDFAGWRVSGAVELVELEEDAGTEPVPPGQMAPSQLPIANCPLPIEQQQQQQQQQQPATPPRATGGSKDTAANAAARSNSPKSAVAPGSTQPRAAVPPAPPERYDWQSADAASVRARLGEGGLATMRRRSLPLAAWVEQAREQGADVLIANALENTPYITADHRVLAEHGPEVVRGLAILAKALGIAKVTMAVDRRLTGEYRKAVAPARVYGIAAVSLDHKYPTGADELLAKVLTQRVTPLGGTPLDVGVAVVDAATCWAVCRWVELGERPSGRVVTVTGPRVARPGNYLVPYGALAADVLALAGASGEGVEVHGSAMNGRQLDGPVAVTARANALLALPAPQVGRPTPCIRCGWCVQNCPARLNVSSLNDDFELGRIERAQRTGAQACVRCGICSYICPARLPLARRVGLLIQAIVKSQQLQRESTEK
jgi:electron transport complex protein RnfC